MNLELVGKFYDNHSLSIINRNLALKLKELGVTFCITALDQYSPESGLLKSDVKTLNDNELKDISNRIIKSVEEHTGAQLRS